MTLIEEKNLQKALQIISDNPPFRPFKFVTCADPDQPDKVYSLVYAFNSSSLDLEFRLCISNVKNILFDDFSCKNIAYKISADTIHGVDETQALSILHSLICCYQQKKDVNFKQLIKEVMNNA